jgi:hypothetical protein
MPTPEDVRNFDYLVTSALQLSRGELLLVVTGWPFRRRRTMLDDLAAKMGWRVDYTKEQVFAENGVRIILIGSHPYELSNAREFLFHRVISFDLSTDAESALKSFILPKVTKKSIIQTPTSRTGKLQ